MVDVEHASPPPPSDDDATMLQGSPSMSNNPSSHSDIDVATALRTLMGRPKPGLALDAAMLEDGRPALVFLIWS